MPGWNPARAGRRLGRYHNRPWLLPARDISAPTARSAARLPASRCCWPSRPRRRLSRRRGRGRSVRPPSWVKPQPLPAERHARCRSAAESGRLYLLVDHQVRAGATTTDYRRYAWTALSTAGVQNASEIQLHFDPTFERLVIHHVRLLRDGRDVFSFRPVRRPRHPAGTQPRRTDLQRRADGGRLPPRPAPGRHARLRLLASKARTRSSAAATTTSCRSPTTRRCGSCGTSSRCPTGTRLYVAPRHTTRRPARRDVGRVADLHVVGDATSRLGRRRGRARVVRPRPARGDRHVRLVGARWPTGPARSSSGSCSRRPS